MPKLPQAPCTSSSSCDDFAMLKFALALRGQKWFIPVLSSLSSHGELRYSAIQKMQNSISKKTLSYVLQSLERYGLVVRKIKLSHPPQVTYSLSERGHSLIQAMSPLKSWIQNEYDNILSDANEFDERTTKEVRAPWQL